MNIIKLDKQIHENSYFRVGQPYYDYIIIPTIHLIQPLKQSAAETQLRHSAVVTKLMAN